MAGMTPSHLSLLAHAGDVRVAPDGRRVAYTVTTVDPGANRYRTRIWLAAADGSTPPRALTSGAGGDGLPRWSPDGRQLAFVSDRRAGGPGGEVEVRVIPCDAPGESVEVCRRPDDVTELAWSPGGDRLAFVARDPDHDRYGSPGSEPDVGKLAPRRLTRLFWSLNGQGWTYDRPEQLYVVPVEGTGGPVAVTSGPWPVSGAAWSPDGTRLAFVAARHDRWDLDLCNDIWLVDAARGGDPEAVTDTSASWGMLSWSPDGASLAYLTDPSPLDGPRHLRLGVLDMASGRRRDLSGDLDRNAGPYPHSWPAVWSGDDLYFPVEDSGAVHVYRVGREGGKPEPVVPGERVVTAFDAAGGTLAAVATTPTELSEVVVVGPGGERRLTDLTRPLRDQVELVAPERFTATSADGTEVECWAMAPVGLAPGKRAPTILNIHGGPFTSYGYPLFDEFQLQAGAGFGVVYCNPRGSSGYSEAWGRAVRWPEAPTDPGSGWGGVDYDDVMACVEEACRRFPWVDPARLGVQGGSYGGYLTGWIVGHTDRFAAACAERGALNLLMLEYDSDVASAFRAYVGHSHVERPDIYTRQSPSTYVADMRTPMLLIHSEDDLRCPINQSVELFVGLRLLGRDPVLVRFPGENHELSRSGTPTHRTQRAELILDWFRDKLGPTG